ncbi:HNH endonuclease [Mycolicibacterium fortuitum]|uniref:HNH endonuclease n=1 Tax=Mycolicibacterium fortuitum TaxID=1766 RepID=UPI0007E9C5AD|nr:HNH endonuclease [Mycolicibacterium fortuitum]OBB41788.1 hypothetical protein A5754_01910 [Mycolicibacterium fortuitum]OBB69098.1 hypothetical protein A5755_17260 [Mycolicibacterium fortuitum]OBF66357.1 hypothetical protein A5751_02295 [Mycolicibacterium fortuitum]
MVADADDRAKKQRGPLRIAIDDSDYESIITAIRGKAAIDSITDCWIWTGASVKSRKGGEYPVFKSGRRQWQAHRLALEAKLGASLGRQTAHHICANSMCVNPDHLQQVTSRENVAEMLARNDYVRRIVALESALRAADPTNSLLAEAPPAGVLRTA